MSPEKLRHEIASAFQINKERSSDEEICILCPVPGCGDKNGNRFINVKTLFTNCWRCQGKQPNHVRTLFQILGLELDDQHVLAPEELRDLLRGTPEKAITPVQEVKLPDGFEFLTENRKSCYWRFCREMAERKHLDIEDLEEANAGFTRDGEWEPFCIFPVIEGPRVVYFQGRTYNDSGKDKTKKFPSKKDIPYGQSYWVYNLDALADEKIEIIVIVESILNVLSLRKRLRELEITHIMPVCVFTHYITRSQVAKLRRYRHVKEWCFLYDSDSTELAEETTGSLSALMPCSIAAMPTGLNADGSIRATNDANDDVDAALLAINDRTRSNPDKLKSMKLYPFQDGSYTVSIGQEIKSKHFIPRSKKV